jgi:hypothetical protein
MMEDNDKTETKRREAVVLEQYQGILPYYEAFYIRTIIYAAGRSEEAFERFEVAVGEAVSSETIMSAVQEALTHAAALSRFFWPSDKRNVLAVARGKRLREAFRLDDTSSLKNRGLRNAFEHFDEHLDRFLLKEPMGYVFPDPIVEEHTITDEVIGSVFRLVDPTNGICVLLGRKFEYRPIRAEVRNILAGAKQMDEQGSRLPK